MSVSLQVLYPTENGTTFDYDYYSATHMAIVGEHMAPHFESAVIAKGLAGGPDVPPAFHAIATMVFADADKRQAALDAAGPALADIPNFFSGQPVLLIGDVIG
ncbi:MAG: hypothetical protein ACJASV_003054 [Pseudorhodobacter sp.]|jgi:uncharacterized protein (TIGR02118 family)